jgi:WhiB family redox-sensing transcriptional regulator
MFYGGDGEQYLARQKREEYAKKTYCGPCPVSASCFEHALEHGEFGIWGGTNEEERKRERRRRARLARIAAEHELAKAEPAEAS